MDSPPQRWPLMEMHVFSCRSSAPPPLLMTWADQFLLEKLFTSQVLLSAPQWIPPPDPGSDGPSSDTPAWWICRAQYETQREADSTLWWISVTVTLRHAAKHEPFVSVIKSRMEQSGCGNLTNLFSFDDFQFKVWCHHPEGDQMGLYLQQTPVSFVDFHPEISSEKSKFTYRWINETKKNKKLNSSSLFRGLGEPQKEIWDLFGGGAGKVIN